MSHEKARVTRAPDVQQRPDERSSPTRKGSQLKRGVVVLVQIDPNRVCAWKQATYVGKSVRARWYLVDVIDGVHKRREMVPSQRLRLLPQEAA